MTGGGLNLVGITTELGVASLLIAESSKFVVCSNIEARACPVKRSLRSRGTRLRLSLARRRGDGVDPETGGRREDRCDVSFPKPRCYLTTSPGCAIPSPGGGGTLPLAGGAGLNGVGEDHDGNPPGEKESDVVGRLCAELWKDRIDPITLMSAADDRVANFRHPIPTERKVEKYLMVSVNARKWGLIVSLTRFLHFGKLPENLRQKYLANVYIDCTFMAPPGPECRHGKFSHRGSRPIAPRVSGRMEAPPPGRVHRLHRQGLPHEFPDPGCHPGESGLHLEPFHHRDEIRGHHPGTRNDLSPSRVRCYTRAWRWRRPGRLLRGCHS